jgi:uncharacterized Zn-binding protein involved in type VI secretion
MGAPAAKQGDQVVGVDIHIVMVPAVAPIPTPLPHPFTGVLDGALATNVKVMGAAAATQDSTASNTPPHIATPPGVSFQAPPANKGRVMLASQSVKFGGKPAARMGDTAFTCNDPVDVPGGTVIAAGTVLVGG